MTGSVIEGMAEWQKRPLGQMWPVVFLHCVFVRVRDGGTVANKAVYLGIGLDGEGRKEILGLWIGNSEGEQFWLSVLNELKARGLRDILIAAVDWLKAFPEAIGTAYPQAIVQTSIVHLPGYSLSLLSGSAHEAPNQGPRPYATFRCIEIAIIGGRCRGLTI